MLPRLHNICSGFLRIVHSRRRKWLARGLISDQIVFSGCLDVGCWLSDLLGSRKWYLIPDCCPTYYFPSNHVSPMTLEAVGCDTARSLNRHYIVVMLDLPIAHRASQLLILRVEANWSVYGNALQREVSSRRCRY